MDYFVETSREQLERLTLQIVQAAEQENAQGIIDLLSDNLLLNNGLDKNGASLAIENKLARPLIDANIVTKLFVTSSEDTTGQVEFNVITTIDRRSSYAIVPAIRTSWIIEYTRENTKQEYRVSNIVMTAVNDDKSQVFDVFRFRPPSM